MTCGGASAVLVGTGTVGEFWKKMNIRQTIICFKEWLPNNVSIPAFDGGSLEIVKMTCPGFGEFCLLTLCNELKNTYQTIAKQIRMKHIQFLLLLDVVSYSAEN
jgi:hypothetical protein